jgi:heterodisulfide reductase subunit A-like polyferredoxin
MSIGNSLRGVRAKAPVVSESDILFRSKDKTDWILAYYNIEKQSSCCYHECPWDGTDALPHRIYHNAKVGKCCICADECPEDIKAMWFLHNFNDIAGEEEWK